jgi:hypothetical protein
MTISLSRPRTHSACIPRLATYGSPEAYTVHSNFHCTTLLRNEWLSLYSDSLSLCGHSTTHPSYSSPSEPVLTVLKPAKFHASDVLPIFQDCSEFKNCKVHCHEDVPLHIWMMMMSFICSCRNNNHPKAIYPKGTSHHMRLFRGPSINAMKKVRWS